MPQRLADTSLAERTYSLQAKDRRHTATITCALLGFRLIRHHCAAHWQCTVRRWLYGTDCTALTVWHCSYLDQVRMLVSRSSAHAQYCARTNTTSLHFECKTVEATCTRCTESDERDLPDCFLKRVLFYPCLFRSLSQKKMFLPFFTHNEQIIQNCDVPYKSQQLDD